MRRADYLVNGTMMVNEITFCNRRKLSGVIGGGAVCTAAGAGLWGEWVLLAADCGEDGGEYFSPWMDSYGLVRDGVQIKREKSNRFFLRYREDGGYEEGLLGQEGMDWSQIGFITLAPEKMEPYCQDIEGMYSIMGIDADYRTGMDDIKEKYESHIVWEVAAATTDQEHLEDFYRILPTVDYHSLNLKEARNLFGLQEERKVIAHMADLGVPVYFRMGAGGAYPIEGGRIRFMPSYTSPGEADPTGCGNASTAATMVGLVERRSPEEIYTMAAVAASFNARQYGPQSYMNEEKRREAETLAAKIMREVTL